MKSTGQDWYYSKSFRKLNFKSQTVRHTNKQFVIIFVKYPQENKDISINVSEVYRFEYSLFVHIYLK